VAKPSTPAAGRAEEARDRQRPRRPRRGWRRAAQRPAHHLATHHSVQPPPANPSERRPATSTPPSWPLTGLERPGPRWPAAVPGAPAGDQRPGAGDLERAAQRGLRTPQADLAALPGQRSGRRRHPDLRRSLAPGVGGRLRPGPEAAPRQSCRRRSGLWRLWVSMPRPPTADGYSAVQCQLTSVGGRVSPALSSPRTCRRKAVVTELMSGWAVSTPMPSGSLQPS
jgi:hypothetical protein